MAVTQAGTTTRIGGFGTANTGTVSSTLTVPADAELVIVCISGYDGTASHFSGGGMTFTKGGTDTAMTLAAAADTNTSVWNGAMWYLVAPDTGSNKSLKWDWASTDTTDDNAICAVISYWKGIDTGSPVRDSDKAQANGFPVTLPSLTAQTGDLIVIGAATLCIGGEGSINSWTNATTLEQYTAGDGNADFVWATHSPSGNVVISADSGTNWPETALMGIVLKPAGAAGGAAPVKMNNMREQGMS